MGGITANTASPALRFAAEAGMPAIIAAPISVVSIVLSEVENELLVEASSTSGTCSEIVYDMMTSPARRR